MHMRIRHSIRGKLLLFYSVAILAVVLLDLSIQLTAYGAINEFEGRLSRYHSVHRLRLELAEHYKRVERLLREGTFTEGLPIEQELHDFLIIVSGMELAEPESLNAFFALQATQRGIEAYFERLDVAIDRRLATEKDWYQDLAYAGRISGYMDSYLSSFLSEAMYYGEARYQALIQRISKLRRLTIGGLILFVVLFGMGAVAFSSSVAGPIRRLANASERIAAGELDVPEVHAPTGDEVEVLARSFNTMSKSIASMLADLKGKADLERRLREEERELMEKERSLREAKFISLQDQIQPHFLFNALNTIARMALFEGAKETERLSLALGKLFRYALGAPESMVPVAAELGIVEEYLAFQALRFGDRLSWTISAKAAAKKVLIPRFSIQPFVENAVRHGIEPREEGGSVSIVAHVKGDRLVLNIRDTGVGMAPGEKGRKAPGAEPGIDGIGIANVRKRLELRYGEAAHLSIKSEAGKGTRVHISLPAVSAEEIPS
ncbi:MAG: HAMP domain-containing protein [Spirochaetales bacterium]|nr:MAG: HAMP domain-containing protein [Spirochaetales bacterium]